MLCLGSNLALAEIKVNCKVEVGDSPLLSLTSLEYNSGYRPDLPQLSQLLASAPTLHTIKGLGDPHYIPPDTDTYYEN